MHRPGKSAVAGGIVAPPRRYTCTTSEIQITGVACLRVYRFLLAPRWLAFAALMLLAAATMVGLGRWQLARYHERSAINARIDAAGGTAPVAVTGVLRAGAAPPESAEWTRVTAIGHFDPVREILVRGRTLDGRVGFEVVTPLVLTDGTALLVDRGWIPPAGSGMAARPTVPAAPTGEMTVTGRVRLPESHAAAPEQRDGTLETRRIAPAVLARALPYPGVLGGYVTAEGQPGFSPIPVEKENAGMNAGYVVQWWMFAALTLGGLIWAVRREARKPAEAVPVSPAPAP